MEIKSESGTGVINMGEKWRRKLKNVLTESGGYKSYRVVIPKKICDEYGWSEDSVLCFEMLGSEEAVKVYEE